MKRLVCLLVIALAGCVTTQPNAQGAQVRITTNPEVVRGCKYLGEVKGADHMNGGTMGQGAAEETARNRLKNNAAKMGANVVMISTQSVNTSGATILGEAYRCG